MRGREFFLVGEVSKSAGETQVHSVLTLRLMKFVLALPNKPPSRYQLCPMQMRVLAHCHGFAAGDFCVKASKLCLCDVAFFFFFLLLLPSALLHAPVSAHLPNPAAVCTLAPVFSRAEEGAAE